MTTEKRYLGRIKTANTTPPSLTIIPEDPTTRPGYDIALGLSKKQLSEFLFAFGDGEMRVSYVLRPGRTGVLEVQDVQSVFADVKVEEVERARSGSADGPGEVRSRRGKNGSPQVGFVPSDQSNRTSFVEEARRNAKGEFRKRISGLPSNSDAMKSKELNGGGG